MSCARCQQHRTAIREAVRSGSIKSTAVETGAALRTLNEKMVARLLAKKRSK